MIDLTPFIPLSWEERGKYKKEGRKPLLDSPEYELFLQGINGDEIL